MARLELRGRTGVGVLEGLKPHAQAIRSTLLQTNLVGDLKVVFSPGDMFLLGLFLASSPTYPLGLMMNKLSRYNLLQAVNVGIVFVYVSGSHVNALGLAGVLLVCALLLTVLYSIPVYSLLRQA